MAASMEFKRKIPDNMNPWTCEVNGVKYVYEASTEQDVPEEVAHIIDAYWKSMEPVKGSSGGAGGLKILHALDNDEYLYKSREFRHEDKVSEEELYEYARSGIVIYTDYGSEAHYDYPVIVAFKDGCGTVVFNDGRKFYSKEYVSAPPV